MTYHKGLIPPPNTRHILLSVISSIQLEPPVIEDPRPRSAPHPSRQRKVTPLLQAIEQMKEMEIRPHSSPPCVTQNDTKLQRKPFKNRVHPECLAADGNHTPGSHTSEEADHSGDETPLIPSAKESSAISSAMSPKRLFNRFNQENNNIFDKRSLPSGTEVIINPVAPEILIVEDISDVSSLSSFVDDESAQLCLQECQPHGASKYNAPDISVNYANDNIGYMPPASIDPSVHSYVRNRKDLLNTGNSLRHQTDNDRYSKKYQSAIVSPLYNNLDINTDKNLALTDKNLNFKPAGQRVSELKAETIPAMHVLQGSHSVEQSVSVTNHLVAQSLHMQDHKSQHHNKEIWTDMQSRGRNIENHPNDHKKEPMKQKEHSSQSHRVVHCRPVQDGDSVDLDQYSKQNGATRPKLHGRSQTIPSMPLDRQAESGGTQKDMLSKSAHAGSIKVRMIVNEITGLF